MKRETYQRGLPGVKWGIWNCQRKCFQFSNRFHNFLSEKTFSS